ncbi:MAG: hypothetical protein J6A01_08525, partial [Proteobacteria bacterium]|nr:hypothetical protein [Pseudomonadota bacterium]
TQDTVQAKLAIAKLYLYFKSIDIKDIVWNSRNMVWLYKVIYSQVDPNAANDDDYYCACGTDVCNKGVGCAAKNNTFVCTALNAPEEGECDPILVDSRYVAYVMAEHLLPIFSQVSTLREKLAANSNDPVLQKLAGSEYLTKDLFKYYSSENSYDNPEVFFTAELFYASICECLNGSSKDGNGIDICPSTMNITIPGALASSTKGVPTQLYKMIRQIAASLLVNQKILEGNNPDELAESTDPKIAKEIDDFIIEQVSYLINSNLNLTQQLQNDVVLEMAGKIKNKTFTQTDVTHAKAKVIKEILRNMLKATYGNLPKAEATAHRQFFGNFVLRSLPPEDKNNLFSMTFVQNTRCLDTATVVTQTIGTKQFCHSNMFNAEGGTLTYSNLIKIVLPDGIEGTVNAANLADIIIMNETYVQNFEKGTFNMPVTVKDSTGKEVTTTVSVDQLSVYLGDDNPSNEAIIYVNGQPNSLKGYWQSYRCPGGASYTEDNECGICSNSPVKHLMNNPYAKEGEPTTILAACVNGLPQVDNSTVTTPSDQQQPGEQQPGEQQPGEQQQP